MTESVEMVSSHTDKGQAEEMAVAKAYQACEVDVGYHPEGYRVDKTASPMNRYTRWEVKPDGKWVNPKPVCFSSMPASGWIKVRQFDWRSTCK